MTENAASAKTTVPYVGFKTFRNFIDRLKHTAVPPAIDNSILTSMAGSTKAQLKATMRFLGLIDRSDNRTEKLTALVSAFGSDTWSDELEKVIADAYRDICGDVDLAAGTPMQLDAAFRSKAKVDGSVLDKAVRFYLAALKDAGVRVSPHLHKRPSVGKRTRSKSVTPKTPAAQAGPRSQGDNGKSVSSNGYEPLQPPEGTIRFQLPVPGKLDSIVLLPADIDGDDWEMLKIQLDAYVKRVIK